MDGRQFPSLRHNLPLSVVVHDLYRFWTTLGPLVESFAGLLSEPPRAHHLPQLCAAGVAVAKHGNRAITSQAGSADVLEELGLRINLAPDEAANSLRDRHFAFFFAPKYHPAFRHIVPARKLCAERGQSTIFNFLGPLLNPARPSAATQSTHTKARRHKEAA